MNNAPAVESTNHSLQIDKRRHTVITGVSDVCSFHETEIVLKLDSCMLILNGRDLHIARLLLEEGKLFVDGHVDSVVYETPKRQIRRLAFWKKENS